MAEEKEKPPKLDDMTYIVLDLLYSGENLGFQLLRYLRRYSQNSKLIMLSRSRNTDDIQTALNEGALAYITKDRIFALTSTIPRLGYPESYLEDKIKKDLLAKHPERIRFFTLPSQVEHLSFNFQSLYRLPQRVIVELMTEKIEGKVEEKSRYNQDLDWIKSLPKAELHCHIGGNMSVSLIRKLAWHTAVEILSNRKEKIGQAEAEKICKSILGFVFPFAMDPFLLFKDGNPLNDKEVDQEEIRGDLKKFRYISSYQNCFLRKGEGRDIRHRSFLELVEQLYDQGRSNKIPPEEILLSPDINIFEKLKENSENPDECKSGFLRKKAHFRECGISYEEIICYFIILITMREKLKEILTNRGINIDEIKNLLSIHGELEDVKERAQESYVAMAEMIQSQTRELEDIKGRVQEGGVDNSRIPTMVDEVINKCSQEENMKAENEFIRMLNTYFKRSKVGYLLRLENWDKKYYDENNIFLKTLVEAANKLKGNTLSGYLRGCEYSGATLLQFPENIILTCFDVVKRAVKDNICYLELRVAPDGYTKLGLQTFDSAIRFLLYGFDMAVFHQYYVKKKRIMVNLIMTGKRHKPSVQISRNVACALMYRDRNLEKEYGKLVIPCPDITRIVGFDLAGKEKGNRPIQVQPDFLPLFKNCYPVTIHAGEDDSVESIWQAVYVLHASRLGHALRLRDNPDLMRIVRENQITIELCPYSNSQTNKFKTPDFDAVNWNAPDYYPLKKYLNDGLKVTINTDNPTVSGATLSEEYMKAAELSGGLTRWEILRIIKNGFKGAFLERKEKRKLLDDVDETVYKIIAEKYMRDF